MTHFPDMAVQFLKLSITFQSIGSSTGCATECPLIIHLKTNIYCRQTTGVVVRKRAKCGQKQEVLFNVVGSSAKTNMATTITLYTKHKCTWTSCSCVQRMQGCSSLLFYIRIGPLLTQHERYINSCMHDTR
jgi:hypothetical protein